MHNKIKFLSTYLTAGKKKGFSLEKKVTKGFHAIFQLKKGFSCKNEKKKFFFSKKKAKTFLKGSPGMPVSPHSGFFAIVGTMNISSYDLKTYQIKAFYMHFIFKISKYYIIGQFTQ